MVAIGAGTCIMMSHDPILLIGNDSIRTNEVFVVLAKKKCTIKAKTYLAKLQDIKSRCQKCSTDG